MMGNKRAKSADDILEIQNMILVLNNDVRHFWKILEKDDSQLIRRTFIRTLFAAIEASLYQAKMILIYANNMGYISLLPEELVLLLEKNYQIDDKGKAKPINNFQSFRNNFLFIYNTLFRYVNISYQIDKKDKHWGNLITILKTRNRLMHPKLISDLNVNDLELRRAKEVAMWKGTLQAHAVNSLVTIEAKFNPKLRQELSSGNFWENIKSKVKKLGVEEGLEMNDENKNLVDEFFSLFSGNNVD
jgi:hypothetical protein